MFKSKKNAHRLTGRGSKALSLFAVAALCSVSLLAQNAPSPASGDGTSAKPFPDTDALISRVASHQKDVEALLTQYTFTDKTTLYTLDKTGTVCKQHTDTYYITPTAYEVFTLHISHDGKPLSQQNLEHQEKEIERKLKTYERKAQKNPGAKPKDALLFADIILKSKFEPLRWEDVDGTPAIVYTFAPKAQPLRHGSEDDKIASDMKGKMWINPDAAEVVRMEFASVSPLGLNFLVRVKNFQGVVDQRKINGECGCPAVRISSPRAANSSRGFAFAKSANFPIISKPQQTSSSRFILRAPQRTARRPRTKARSEVMASASVLTEPVPTESSREQTYKLQTMQPLSEKERIVSIDVLRGFALLGILPMNIQYFSMISAAYSNPTAYGDLTGVNYWVWLLCHVFADEKFMTIFSMLFGAGILLMTSRIEAAGKPSAGLHYRRMGWLIGFGLAHAYLLWSGDILVTYGMCGLIAYLFRKMRPRMLIVLGLIAIAVASAVLAGYGIRSQHWSPRDVQAATEDLWKPTPAEAASEIKAYRGTWLDQMKFRAPDSARMETNFFVGFTFWRVTGLMLVGMALFKLGFFGARRRAPDYWTMIAIALAAGIPLILYGTHRDFANGWGFRYSFFYGAQFNYWASIMVSLGWVGVMMLASRAAALLALTRRLAAVGRMAFTNYIMHTLICTTIFYGHGFGLFGKVERIWQFAIVVAIWVAQLLLSPIWLKHFLFGPLEWLWRSLTYWQWEPFRRYTSRVGYPSPC